LTVRETKISHGFAKAEIREAMRTAMPPYVIGPQFAFAGMQPDANFKRHHL
jgi:hypothetical protein